jgi:hypothetical protein
MPRQEAWFFKSIPNIIKTSIYKNKNLNDLSQLEYIYIYIYKLAKIHLAYSFVF